jgi:hypothetical protein
MNRGIASLFSGKRSSSSKKVSKGNQSAEITAQIEEAEASESGFAVNNANASSDAVPAPAGYTPAPVSSSSSSWSSNPPEVPYVSAGGTDTRMNSSARRLASQTPSQQSQHWMPTPQYLAAQSSSKQLAVPPHLQATNERTSPSSSSSNEFPYSAFPSTTTSRPQTSTTQTTTKKNPSYSSSGARILHPQKTRFQEFSEELKELVQDLLEYTKAKTWKKKCMAVLLCLSSVLVFYDLIFGKYIIEWLHTFILWMSVHSIEAVFAFIGIFVVATCKCSERICIVGMQKNSHVRELILVSKKLVSLCSNLHSTDIVGVWCWLRFHCSLG